VARASCARRVICRSVSSGESIIRSASSSMITTRWGNFFSPARGQAGVVIVDIARSSLSQLVVALVHLARHPFAMPQPPDPVQLPPGPAGAGCRYNRLARLVWESTISNRRSSGVLNSSRQQMMEFTHTDLPEPLSRRSADVAWRPGQLQPDCRRHPDPGRIAAVI